MANAASFWTFAGSGLLVMTIGASWVIQSRILSCSRSHKPKLAQRLMGSGYMVIGMGIGYVVLSALLLH